MFWLCYSKVLLLLIGSFFRYKFAIACQGAILY